METNDEVVQDTQNTVEDKTSQNDELESKVKTLDAQRQNWKNKAVDPDTGKTYKELYDEAKKADKTVENDKKAPNEFGLLEKTYLRSAGVTAEDEVELAKDIQKKTGMDWDQLVDDDYFQTKLEDLRTSRANVEATSDIKGGGGGQSGAKNTPEYWVAKGVPPTAEQVPDRKTRVKIARAFMTNSKEGKKFYNDK